MEINIGRLVIKAGAYFLFLACWLIVGGWFTLGPWLAHNIDRVVGPFVLYAAALSWAALPVTALIATVKHESRTRWAAFVAHVLLWLLFLGALYIRWIRAYPHG